MNFSAAVAKIKLQGTAPQVKWAIQIRQNKVKEVHKLGTRALMVGIRPHISEEALQAMGCTSNKHILQFVSGVGLYMLSCPQAMWWVQHRDEPVHKWIAGAVKQCVEHYRKTKPFK